MSGKDVAIFDTNGKLFYFQKDFKKVFNLPKGVYYTNCHLKMESRPRIYKTKKLPKKERNFKMVFPKIVLNENPNKCSIRPSTGEIYFDRNFFNTLNETEKNFVIFHEIGHYFYSTETFADFYSLVQMIKLGYNPSQIGNAISKTLDIERNSFRIKNLINNFIIRQNG